MNAKKTQKSGWESRKARVRKKVLGTAERPRLNVYRSNRHIYAQVIDDAAGRTIVAASTRVDGIADNAKKAEAAKKVGEIIGRLAKEKGVEMVVFDRSGYIYHGRMQALADGARAAGLKF